MHEMFRALVVVQNENTESSPEIKLFLISSFSNGIEKQTNQTKTYTKPKTNNNNNKPFQNCTDFRCFVNNSRGVGRKHLLPGSNNFEYVQGQCKNQF